MFQPLQDLCDNELDFKKAELHRVLELESELKSESFETDYAKWETDMFNPAYAEWVKT